MLEVKKEIPWCILFADYADLVGGTLEEFDNILDEFR